jgi:hypothetical protein
MFSLLFKLSKSIFKSATTPSYYPKLLKYKKSFAWTYFHFFNLLTTIIITIPLFLTLSQLKPSQLIDKIKQIFPNELDIHIQSQQININQPLPYFIQHKHINMVVFEDEKKLDDSQNISQYNTPILISQHFLYIIPNYIYAILSKKS